MIPSTVTGILAFLLLIGPGFLYIRRVEKLDALYRVSAFRETISIIFVGFSCDAASLVLFGLTRMAFPSSTPDVGSLVRQGERYWESDYNRIAWFVAAVYFLALLMAFVASHPAIRKAKVWTKPAMQRIIGAPMLDSRSAWSRLFDVDEDTIVRVGCDLDDGSWVDGWIYDWNAQPEEDAERTFVLQEPICLRVSGHPDAKYLAGINFVNVSHGRIVRLDVTHVDKTNQAAFDEEYESR